MQAQEDHNLARRKDAEDAVETLYFAIGNEIDEDAVKALEFLSWEAGVLEHFKRLRDE